MFVMILFGDEIGQSLAQIVKSAEHASDVDADYNPLLFTTFQKRDSAT